ncbi:MAG: caspase family protein [Bradyrhizobium sp.]
MRFRFPLLLALIFTVVSTAPSSAAGNRYALVIGNANYPFANAPLADPINDAHDVAAELKRDGFKVDVEENLTIDGMRGAFQRLDAEIKPGDAVLLFFSGYGIQVKRESYMIPVDARLWRESDVRRDGFSLEKVLDDINDRGAGVKIALLDASRRNPYERNFRSYSAGLAPVEAPNGTLVMYSAALSSVLPDNGTAHGLFVQELLKEIRVPNLSAEETLNRTRVGVTRASRQKQIPWISSSLAEDFSFVPGPGNANGPGPIATLPSPKPRPQPEPPAPTPLANLPPPSPAPVPSPTPLAKLPPPSPTPVPNPTPLADLPSPSPPQIPIPPAPKPGVNNSGPTQLALSEDPTIKSLTAKIDRNPNDIDAYYRRGQIYASRGAYHRALTDFSDTIRQSPRDVEALNNRCWVRTVLGDLQGALKDCNEALRLRPGFVDALDSRGLANLKSGRNKKAIVDYDAALRINPRLTSSLYGRGLARQRLGSMTKGHLDITHAESMDPNIVREFEGYGVH